MKVRQLFIDAYECSGPLDSAEELMHFMRESIHMVGAKIVNSCRTSFQPHGVTNVLVLAESHFVVSTWPEYGYASVDILLCNDDMNPMDVWLNFRACLKPGREASQTFYRCLQPTNQKKSP